VVSRFQAAHADPESRRPRHPRTRRLRKASIRPAGGHPSALRQRSKRRGIARLYSHQAEAFAALGSRQNVVVVTPTASGKTPATPARDQPAAGRRGRPRHVPVPDQALAEDQLHEFQGAVDAMGAQIRAFTYDGDTPQDARKPSASAPTWVLTNPGHAAFRILPHHTKWARYFENLRLYR